MTKTIRTNIRSIHFWLIALSVLAVIYDFGFTQPAGVQRFLYGWYTFILAVAASALIARYLFIRNRPRSKVLAIDAFFLGVLVITVIAQAASVSWLEANLPEMVFLKHHGWSYLLIFLSFLRELSEQNLGISRKLLNPAQLFVTSFLLLVVTGALLLLLPNATHMGISLTDALFTSVSAVCVTGLVVVDTGTHFTLFGHTIILILIQVGGLGIMTFTSYFSHFFRGGSSFESHLVLGDMTNEQKISEVFTTLRRIVTATLLVEAAGAFFIYMSLDSLVLRTMSERVFFSIFHSVSAFCNAGFSTLSAGFYDIDYRHNYSLHLVVAFLFIFGGLGFPIMFNFLNYLKQNLKVRWYRFTHRPHNILIPQQISVNSKIVLVTTAILIAAGTVVFFIFEYNRTLAEHGFFGRLVTAFFGGVTPRTAGFNTVDMGKLHFATVMFTLLLMWIGASPGSTGGGIKTSTLAIATLNFFSLARGKDRVEVFRREISEMSLRRAFAAISLSLVATGVSIFAISVLDSDMRLVDIAFECFSAYSTVGLSLAGTANFSTGSKLVLIATMFAGRVGMLTLLAAVLKKISHLNYNYPSEDILIN